MAKQALDEEVLMTEDDAAKFLGLSTRTLQRLRANDAAPRFIRLGDKKIRYRKSDLRHWLASRTT